MLAALGAFTGTQSPVVVRIRPTSVSGLQTRPPRFGASPSPGPHRVARRPRPSEGTGAPATSRPATLATAPSSPRSAPSSAFARRGRCGVGPAGASGQSDHV